MHRARRPALALAAVLLLAGCGAGATAADPNWKPQQSFHGEGPLPSIAPPAPPSQSGTSPGHPGSTRQPSAVPTTKGKPGPDPAVVATKLSAPIGLTLLPDNTALVGERTTGRILQVQPRPGQPVRTVRTLPGIDATGDGGLLDLAISPHYQQDSLIFAYLTTRSDNRVVVFTLSGPVTPVLTRIPKGSTGNAGRIAFGPDGSLYVGTGDAGNAALAANAKSLAGKVLRVSDIGEPAAGNPVPSSPVYASGQRAVAGLCIEPKTATAFEVEATGAVNLLQAGDSYGGARGEPPVTSLPLGDVDAGGCTVQDGTLYVASLGGTALLGVSLTRTGTTVRVGSAKASLQRTYGRLRTVVAAPDGALWLTTSNRDGHGTPIPDDERVLRIVPSGGGGGSVF